MLVWASWEDSWRRAGDKGRLVYRNGKCVSFWMITILAFLIKTLQWLPTALWINSRIFYGGQKGQQRPQPTSPDPHHLQPYLNPSCSSYTDCLPISPTYQGHFCLRAFASAILVAQSTLLFDLHMAASFSSCQVCSNVTSERQPSVVVLSRKVSHLSFPDQLPFLFLQST